ncbi:MAG TPA: response regulator [Acidobacteriota bacterium]|nr:response regulator [Acidobacteriota bacterium]
MKVLIIDDEDDIRQIARFALNKIANWEVLDSRSAADGISLAVSEKPDAILLDVLMPGMDGPAALAALRENPATSAIPVVFLTARGLPDEISNLKRQGAAGVITKPFDPMTLAEDMTSILRGR